MIERTLEPKTAKLVDDMLQGNARALARLITIVEEDGEDAHLVLGQLGPTGRAHRIGITGPPGAGKSTLVNRLTSCARQNGLRVGVICADPSSPFTGGAVLGDRVRMTEHSMDEGVHIRSMSTRGSLGGLPTTVHGVIELMDASGKDVILVETVGVGQMELDVMASVDTVVVALVPEAGDDVQAMKAGLMEIADVFVVNKADRPGAESLLVGIRSMLDLVCHGDGWRIPVLATQAENNIGVEDLYQQIWEHRRFGLESGSFEERRAHQRHDEFTAALQKMVTHQFMQTVAADPQLAACVTRMNAGEISPYEAASEVFRTVSQKLR